MQDDRQLVETFLTKRSESSFRQLYRRHINALFALAFRLSRQDPDLAEELVQQCWITAVEKLPSFQWRSALKTWLCGILINHFKEHQRMEQKTTTFEVHHNEPTTEQREVMDFEEAIRSLPDGYREILILHDVQGFKHREIAEMLSIAEGTSKSQLFQARKAVRKFLNDEPKNGSYD